MLVFRVMSVTFGISFYLSTFLPDEDPFTQLIYEQINLYAYARKRWL